MVDMNRNYIDILFNKIKNQKIKNDKESYTAKLLSNPDLLTKKISEESVEVILEIINKNKQNLINESADLFYHLMVSWIHLNIDPKDVLNELKNREKGLK